MPADCNIILNNLERLDALARTKLFGTLPEEAFTRLNTMATKLLSAPISIFSLIGSDRQFFKSAAGFEISPENNLLPLDVSVCQYTLHGEPLKIEDTLSHPMFSENAAVKALNIKGYLGVPVTTKDGHTIGAVCVIDHKSRNWTEDEISILKDITALFISEIELRQAVSESQEQTRLREEFLAVAAHELKNPLAAMKLQAQVMGRKLERGVLSEEENIKFLTSLQRQTQRLDLLINDMNDLTRLNSGQFQLRKSFTDIVKITDDAYESTKDVLLKAGCVYESVCPETLDNDVDSSRLEQVIVNLLTNSAKYAPYSKVVLTLLKDENDVVLTISDNGPGIAEDQKSKIFAKFSRAEKDKSITGLGLGLFISRQIIEAHGGNLELLKSKVGSSFEIRIPQSHSSH